MTNQHLGTEVFDNKQMQSLAMTSPLEALSRVIFLDTMALSDVCQNTLYHIRLASLEDPGLEGSIGEWRQLLVQASLRLPIARAAILELIQKRRPQLQLFKLSADARKFAKLACQRTSTVMKQAAEMDGLLQAQLSMLVSRKQLSESSSVTKLTELAFIFVPLSFVASAFSMQIQELESPPSLVAFFITAAAVIFTAYLIRVLANSRAFGNAGRRAERAARKYSHIPDSQPLPAGAYITFVFKTFVSLLCSVHSIVVVCLGAIVWLWVGRSQVDSGFKAVLTAVLTSTLPLSIAIPVASDAAPKWLRSLGKHLVKHQLMKRRLVGRRSA
jgi:hypothetical protein